MKKMKSKIIHLLFLFLLPVVALGAGNSISFQPGSGPDSKESKYLYKDSGSLFDLQNGPHRWADSGATFGYKFDLKGIAADVIMVDVCHDYKVEISFDDKDYFTVLESPEDVHNDGNRGFKMIDLKSFRKSERYVYLRFSDRTPDNGWGSCVYEIFVGNQARKKLGKTTFKGESSFLAGTVNTSGKARNLTFDREWFSYFDNGALDRIANLYQALKLNMTSSLMDKYNLDLQFSIDKYNYAWNHTKYYPLTAFDPNYVNGAFIIALQKFQDYQDGVNQKLIIGKIDPEYTSYTVKKKHNGILLDLSKGQNRLQFSGARLKSFNDTSEYLLTGRAETGSDQFKLGVSCALTRYTTKDNVAGQNLLLGSHGSAQPAVYIRVSDSVQDDGNGGRLYNCIVSNFTGGSYHAYDSFTAGDGSEIKYLFDVKGNYYVTPTPGFRQVADNGFVTYRFPITSDMSELKFNADVSGNYQISYSFDGINFISSRVGTANSDANKITETFIVPLLQPSAAASTVTITIADYTPGDGWGGDLYKLDYYEDDKLKISFSPDNGPIEAKYLTADSGSVYASGHRYADMASFFTYTLPVSAGTGRIKILADMRHDYNIIVTMNGPPQSYHTVGYVQGAENHQTVTIDLSSFEYIKNKTYVRTGTSIIGADFSAKVFDADLKGEFARLIDHRVFSSGVRENPGFNAFYLNLDKKISFLDSKIKGEYYYVDPAYDASETVDDRYNLASGTYVKEVYPPRLDFDPLKDMNDNGQNDEDEVTGKPFYLYDPDQNGYRFQILSKPVKAMTTMLFFNGVQEISSDKFGQKYGATIDYLKNIGNDSSFVTKFWSFYTKDSRSVSTIPENLRNFLRFSYNFWGLKNFDFGFGVDQLELIRDIFNLQTTLNSQLALRVRYHRNLIDKLTMMPMLQVLSYRQMIVSPEYSFPQEWNQFIPGIRFEYKAVEKGLLYANYRYAYTDDIRYPENANYYNMFETGFEMQGAVFMRIFYRYLENYYFDKSKSANNWESDNISAEIKIWF